MSPAIPLPQPLPKVVVGERVRLEQWLEARTDEVRSIVERSREELSGFLPWAMEPLTEDAERQVQAESQRLWAAGLQVAWMLLEGPALRGMVGLHRRGGPDELEVGYWLATEATGRGLMTEAVAMATDVAFATGGIEVVEIVHDAANLRSGAIPARLGYARTAAYTSEARARLETGLKVRWQVRKAAWLARGGPPAARHVEP